MRKRKVRQENKRTKPSTNLKECNWLSPNSNNRYRAIKIKFIWLTGSKKEKKNL